MTASPYAQAWEGYWNAGWRGLLPLPHGRKTAPPDGYTGYDTPDPSYADCWAWAETGPRNIALRLPANVIGVDVDHYGPKLGGDTLARLVTECGPLPATWMSSSRADGISGIRFYRVPPGARLITKLPDIEIIQRHHRYAVVAPSAHPDTGRHYEWVNETDGTVTAHPPPLADLPDLPGPWLARLTSDATRPTKQQVDADDIGGIIAAFPDGEPCDHLLRAAGKTYAGGDRHDSYNEATLAVAGLARRGCPGGLNVLRRLKDTFVAEVTAPGTTSRRTRGEADAEWARNLTGAIAIIAAEPQGVSCPDDLLAWLNQQQGQPSDPSGGTPDDTIPPQAAGNPETGDPLGDTHQKEINRRALSILIDQQARDTANAATAAKHPPITAVPLADFLDQADTQTPWLIPDMWPANGRVLLAAAAKTGKTTLVTANLLPALADGGRFLDRYDTPAAPGRTALLNLEVGENTIRRWLRDANITNTRAITIINLRGQAQALTLASRPGREKLAAQLSDAGLTRVILDPLAPLLASLGLDENSNSDIARFFSWWGETMRLAGIEEDLIVHHAGHAGQRSRGASRLLDEPDAIWTLTRDNPTDIDPDDDPLGLSEEMCKRYLAAMGRDVEMPETALDFDPGTRRLTLLEGGKKWAQTNRTSISAQRRVISFLRDHPGATTTDVRECGGRKDHNAAALNELVAQGRVDHEIRLRAGGGRASTTYKLAR